MTDSPPLWKAIKAFHYTYPIFTMLYFVVAVPISMFQAPSRDKRVHVRRDVILWLMVFPPLAYVLQALLLVGRSFVQEGWVPSQDEVVYLISSAILWAGQGVVLWELKFLAWYPHYVNWTAAAISELILLVLSVLNGRLDFIVVALQVSRVFNFMILLGVYLGLSNIGGAEHQPLLRDHLVTNQLSSGGETQGTEGYGGTAGASDGNSNTRNDGTRDTKWSETRRDDAGRVTNRLESAGSWGKYLEGFTTFFPYLWPRRSSRLQMRAVFVAFCSLGVNLINFFLPRQAGVIVDVLVSRNDHQWLIEIAIYVALTLAKSDGCFEWLSRWLSYPIEDYGYKALCKGTQAHVMGLSSNFHTSKGAKKIFFAAFRGKIILELVDTVGFQVMSMFIDLTLIFGYLIYVFGPYMALNLVATALAYLYITSKLTALANGTREERSMCYVKEWEVLQSTISNWEIATYFNKTQHEKEYYDTTVDNYIDSENKLRLITDIGAAIKSLLTTVGLFAACVLAAYAVMYKSRSPGDFVVLLTYWNHLQVPFSLFSTMTKSIFDKTIDAERLLELHQTKPSIVNNECSQILQVTKGEVRFENVSFSYNDRKFTLEGIDFTVKGGSIVAIVGETGGGKSTVLGLVERFHDVRTGRITIDDQDIRSVTQESLRKNIGVVPQKDLVFSDTIKNNILYANMDATDDEVKKACESAAIHKKIMTFPDGYDTKVGADGDMLSGGEKRRIAIARLFLKDPKIILLDEATSAIDTETEEQIQEGLRNLCRGRTTFIVAHRLSTIRIADHILVMKEGQIIEQGSHDELIRQKGSYYRMWLRHISVALGTDGAMLDIDSLISSTLRKNSI